MWYRPCPSTTRCSERCVQRFAAGRRPYEMPAITFQRSERSKTHDAFVSRICQQVGACAKPKFPSADCQPTHFRVDLRSKDTWGRNRSEGDIHISAVATVSYVRRHQLINPTHAKHSVKWLFYRKIGYHYLKQKFAERFFPHNGP